MLHLGMSADGREEPVFEAHTGHEGEIDRSFSDYILEDEPHAGLGKVIIRGGFVILFGAALFAGFHFVQDSRADRQLAGDTSVIPDQTNKKDIRKIDLTQTGSIKDTTKLVLDRPIPIELDKPVKQKVHVVQPGDTLSAISRKHNVSAKEIIALNSIENPRLIKPGMKLKVSR